MRRSFALLSMMLTACHAHLPRGAPVRHAVRQIPVAVALPPLVDDRESDDAEDLFVYRGVELVHTDLSRLERSPSAELTELFARRLLGSGLFARIILVDRVEDAPEADLVLVGRLRRARGYVEAEERKDDPRRLAMAEVLFSNVELRSKDGLIASADLGWSIAEDRTGELDPYALLSEASERAVDQLVELLERSDLSPLPKVTRLSLTSTSATLEELAIAPPKGWRALRAEEAEPAGWRTRDLAVGPCASVRFEMLGRISFHRALGPHVPSVSLWSCPAGASLVMRGEGSLAGPLDFPAKYQGRDSVGRAIFTLSVGRSSWEGAEAELTRVLGARPPAGRYTFELP